MKSIQQSTELRIATMVFCALLSSCSGELPVKWKHFKTANDVRSDLAAHLPVGSSREAILQFLRANGVAQSQIGSSEDAVQCKAKGPSQGWFVAKIWLIKFKLDQGLMTGIEVTEGLVGP